MKMSKNYLITIYHTGLFGNVSTINITNADEGDKFYQYKENCFVVWGIRNGKSVYYSFPLDKINYVNIEECWNPYIPTVLKRMP